MFNLNNKIFTALQNSKNGEVSNQTRFFYFQQDNVIWAEYHGGEILKGFLIGKWISDSQIEFSYQHLNHQLENRLGHCVTTFCLENGKLVGYERWQWLDTLETGQSQIIEIDTAALHSQMAV
ncbi:n-acetylglutamate synthase [Bibersteinia trehalosi]|uniref:n-acetylglutamate synthase n=1 Tax=Bibersteinia trehalosi TaxID=47735 RepID=UPI004045F26B